MRSNKLLGFCIMILLAVAGFAIAQTSINADGGTIVNVNFTNTYTVNWHGYFGSVDLSSYGYNTTTLWKSVTPTGDQIDYSSGNSTPHLGHLIISNSSTAPVISTLAAGNATTDLDPLIAESFDKATLLFVNTSNYTISSNDIPDVPTLYLYQNSTPSTVFRQVLLKDGDNIVFATPLYKTSKVSYNETNVTYQYIVPKIDGTQYSVYTYLENIIPYFNPALADQSILEDSTLIYDANCTDPDGDTLVYYDNTPLFAIDSSTGLINWTPTNDNVGNHTITIYCQDVEVNVTDSFVIEVNNTNDAPYATDLTAIPSTPYTNNDLNCSWIAHDVDVSDTSLQTNVTWFNDSTQITAYDITGLYTIDNQTGYTDHLLISEVNYYDDAGGDNEYVELYNPTNSIITIDSSWKVGDGDSNDTLCNAQISPGAHYLIVDANSTTYNLISDCSAGIAAIGDGLSNTADSVRLYYNDNLIDGVGWGGETVDGTDLTVVVNQTFVRSTKWIDTNSDSDFSTGTTSPQNTGNTVQFPVTTYLNQTLPPSATNKGENWSCQLTIFDSNGGDASYNITTTILNTAPAVSGVNITPTTAYANDTLVGNYTFSDIDTIDTDSSTFKWFRNGSLISGEITQYLGPGNFTRADLVIFEITPYDGETNGTPVNSSAVAISNTAPTMSYANIISNDGANAYENSTLTANVSGTDLDFGDSVSYYYNWYNNGSLISGATSNTLTGTYFNRGDNITLGAIPTDSLLNGTELNSSNNFVIANSIPTITVIIPNGNEIWSGTQNILWSANDLDNDSLTFQISYYNSTDWLTINNSITDPSPYSYTWTLPNANLSGVLVNITVNDTIGFNWDESDQTFNITETDIYPPVITFVSPAANGYYTSQNVLLNVTVNEGVDTCTYELNNSISGTLSGLGNAYSDLIDTTEDGSFNVTVYCNDTSSNIGNNSRVFNVDTGAPQITINSPTASLYSTASLILNVSASEIVYCNYSLNGAANESIINGLTQNSTTITAAHGNNTINLYCTDLAGLENNSESVTFTTDIINPANITDLRAAPGSIEGQIRLNWTAPGDDDMTGTATSYTVKMSTSAINDQNDFDSATTVTQSMTPQAAGNEEILNVSGLASGQYYFAVIAADDVGRTSSVVMNATSSTPGIDVAVNSITHDKVSSTVWLYDTINVTVNVSNEGDLTQDINISLKDNGVVVDSTQVNLNAGVSQDVYFSYAPQNKGTGRSLSAVASVISVESDYSNNQKSMTYEVWSVTDNFNLTWVDPNNYPASSESASSTFYVWARVENLDMFNFNDLTINVGTDGLTVAQSQDNSNTTSHRWSAIDGYNTKTYWWNLNSGAADTKTITVDIGYGADKLTINRNVVIS